MNDAAMLIRFAYAEGYPEAARAWRFAWFREQTLPRILAQRDADFDLWLWINEKHRAEVEAMSPRIRTFTADHILPLDARIPWSAAHDLPRYPIQLRLDSDDLIGPDYVSTARTALAGLRAPRALVWFQPYKVDVVTQKLYWCAPMRRTTRYAYGNDRPSAFLALRQPVDHPDYSWVYGRGHMKAHLLADEVAPAGVGHCVAACHAHNDSTAIVRGDTLIPDRRRPEWL